MFHRIRDILNSSSNPLLLCNCRLYCPVVVAYHLGMRNIHQLLYFLPYLRYLLNMLHIRYSDMCILKIQVERLSWRDKGSMGMNRYNPTCMCFPGTADKLIPVTPLLVDMDLHIMVCMLGVYRNMCNDNWKYIIDSCKMTVHCHCMFRRRVLCHIRFVWRKVHRISKKPCCYTPLHCKLHWHCC